MSNSSPLPQMMRAVIAEPFGGPEVLQIKTMLLPTPAATEVLVKMTASGINRPDILQREGHYKPPQGITNILGLEGAGEIVAAGANVSRFKVGDKVCVLVAGGSYAEYAVVPEGQCLPVPANMGIVEAATLPEGVFTVWANLFESGQLKKGDTALVHGGASGIGTYAIQMAIAAGAKIIVTVGNQEKAELCEKLGATHVINYENADYKKAVLRLTDGRGVDVVMDMVGADYIPRNIDCMAYGGRHVSIATMHGANAAINIRDVMAKNLTLTGSTLRPRSVAEKTRLAREIEAHVWPWIAAGKVKPQLHKSLPIDDVIEAHKLLESGKYFGKLALTF